MSVIIGLGDQRSAVIVAQCIGFLGGDSAEMIPSLWRMSEHWSALLVKHYLPAISLTTSVSGGTKAC